jgi:ABC-type lipoprotein release transport system permease subunit
MFAFVLGQLRQRPGRALALGLGVLVSSVTFILLTGSSRSGELKVEGTIQSNFRPAYDVLVRPRGSATALEQSRGLVRDNYLSGIFGGITLRQWHSIKDLAGVAVAAPIANVGYVFPKGSAQIRINRDLTSDPVQLFRLRFSYRTSAGSRYPAGVAFVYFTRTGVFVRPKNPFAAAGEKVRNEIVPVCSGTYATSISGPFDLRQFSSLSCFSARTPSVSIDGVPLAPGVVSSFRVGRFPLFVAAIDPVEEAKLLHLDRTVVSGRYLHEGERPVVRYSKVAHFSGTSGQRYVSVLAATKTFVAESLETRVERLSIPPGVNVPEALAAGACMTNYVNASGQCPKLRPPPPGDLHRTGLAFLMSLKGLEVDTQHVGFDDFYRSMLQGCCGQEGRVAANQYWSVGDVRYDHRADGVLVPGEVSNPTSVYQSSQDGGGVFLPAPLDNLDTQFRRLSERVGDNVFDPSTRVLNTPRLRVVGRYDPSRLPGFSPLSKVPMETYYPPLLRPADRASAKALHGASLAPTQNLGDYIQQPPLFLTTLTSLPAFLNSNYFSGVPAEERRAPISAIRIRVAGVTGADRRSIARIDSVALRIHELTGLQVDITAGSSPHPLTVRLPKGKFGRPALTLSEGWSKKGVSLSFLHGVDRKQLALFALIPLICCLFLFNGAYAAARARRTEIGTLLTLGWTRAAIFRLLLGELLLVGFAAGLAGVAIAAALVAVLGLHASLLVTLLVLPVAVVLVLVAGLIPAWRASGGRPLDALRPAVSEGRGGGRINRLLGMAVVNLRRVPARAAVGAAGLAVGACALTVLIAVEQAFQGVLAGTVLGDAISVQIRGFDYLAVVLVIALAALSIADVLYLNLRERQAELVTLRTLGWEPRHLAQVVLEEALLIAVAASLVGALAGVLLGWLLLAAPIAPVLIGGIAAAAGGVLAAVVASLLPLSQIGRLTPPTVLASEP